MKEWIEELLKLQEADMRARNLNTRLEVIPEEIGRIEKEIVEDKEKLEKYRETIKAVELEIKQVELDIEQQNSAIQKLERQSVLIKKNDEYKAMLKEVGHHKKIVSNLETKELELMEKLDAAKGAQREQERQNVEKEKSLLEEKEEMLELSVTLKQELEVSAARRDALLEKVDSRVLPRYERLIGKGTGQPLVPVHEGSCGNCHLKLTPQTVNHARKGQQVSCENCGHFVYVDEG